MIKMALKVLPVVILIAAAILLIGPYLNKYADFRSPVSKPAVRFAYPKDWRIKIDQGKIDSYTQVIVLGPRNTQDTYTTSFIIRETPTGPKYKSADELYQNSMKYIYSGAAISEEKSIILDSNSARSLVASYIIPPSRSHGLKPIPVNLKSHAVYADHNNKLYEIIFNADAELFDKYAPDFEHLLKTLRFE